MREGEELIALEGSYIYVDSANINCEFKIHFFFFFFFLAGYG